MKEIKKIKEPESKDGITKETYQITNGDKTRQFQIIIHEELYHDKEITLDEIIMTLTHLEETKDYGLFIDADKETKEMILA